MILLYEIFTLIRKYIHVNFTTSTFVLRIYNKHKKNLSILKFDYIPMNSCKTLPILLHQVTCDCRGIFFIIFSNFIYLLM